MPARVAPVWRRERADAPVRDEVFWVRLPVGAPLPAGVPVCDGVEVEVDGAG